MGSSRAPPYKDLPQTVGRSRFPGKIPPGRLEAGGVGSGCCPWFWQATIRRRGALGSAVGSSAPFPFTTRFAAGPSFHRPQFRRQAAGMNRPVARHPML